VKVDTVLGQVVSYWQYSFPVLVRTLEASVTWEDAVQIGLDQLVWRGGGPYEIHDARFWQRGVLRRLSNGNLTVGELAVTEPDPLGAERLVWWVAVEGRDFSEEHYYNTYYALIAGDTGEVVAAAQFGVWREKEASYARRTPRVVVLKALHWNDHLSVTEDGRKLFLVYRPLLSEQNPMLWIGYLEENGWKLSKPLEDTFVFRRRDEKVVFTVGQRDVEWNGKQAQLAVAPVRLAGHTYVPASLLQGMRELKVEYDEKQRTLKLTWVSDPPKRLPSAPSAVRVAGVRGRAGSE